MSGPKLLKWFYFTVPVLLHNLLPVSEPGKKIDVGQVLVYLTHFLFAVCLATVSFFFESERFLDYELFFHCERHDIMPFLQNL